MKYIFSSVLLFFSFLSIYSCTGSNNRLDSIKQDKGTFITIRHFDKDLYDYLNEETSSEQEDTLKSKYKDFLSAFGTVVIDNSDYNNPDFFPTLRKYFSNEMLSRIYKDVLETFRNSEPYEKELTQANELTKQYFNGKELPVFCIHVSGFKANTIVLQNLISISGDKYLSKDYPLYAQFFEEYQRIQMEPKMIVRDYLKAWFISELPVVNKRKDLLSEMIDQGKILYALQQLLPEWNEADLIGYTTDQTGWAKTNEKSIWQTTVKQNYLYSTEYMTIVKYMDDAPYTTTISQESPGRLGAWIGWQIIKKYAENSKSGLDNILKETDSQKILKESKYNP